MTGKALEEMLKADGWPVERVNETTWRSGFRGSGERFPLYVRMTVSWLFLTIIPFVALPEGAVGELALFRRLLSLNREVTFAKFALEGREVVLTVEVPRENLAWSQLKDGLDALSFYAITHHAELLALAK